MPKYLSILRGINVSGKKKIKMADLRCLYESLGFLNVVTHVQSGNVVLEATVSHRADLGRTIEEAVEARYGFRVPVAIRTNREIGDIIGDCPFGPIDLVENGTRVLVTFLFLEPSEGRVSDLRNYVVAPEELVVRGSEVYLYCPNGYGRSKLTTTFLERKLGVEATTRNWRSVLKLYELSA